MQSNNNNNSNVIEINMLFSRHKSEQRKKKLLKRYSSLRQKNDFPS